MSLPPGARRIRDAFGTPTARRRCLVAYLVAGHPSDGASLDAAAAALDAGAGVLEIGVPFSDPMADGPVIAAAASEAIAAGAGLHSATSLARSLRTRGHRQPILAMAYLNTLVASGVRRTLHELASAGVDGLIVPDLPAGEDRSFERVAADAGLGTCFLVAPNTPEGRIERAAAASTGFLYVVPLYGVTGARDRIAASAVSLIERVRAVADGVPLAVGFGVSKPDHVRRLGSVADGVIVGSALVAALGGGGPSAVGSLVADLVAALEGAVA